MINIDANRILYELVREYPKVKDIMVEAGFGNITKPGMMQSVGRVMTIKKGALIKGIDMKDIKELFEKHGFLLDDKVS